ncbi:MAG TPA: hypothetical protein PLS50_09550, partial [Candidatus Dojkabacteria bacterium]|nr:hypothetical protein [Candidatus Dojkabacteria bacterium]
MNDVFRRTVVLLARLAVFANLCFVYLEPAKKIVRKTLTIVTLLLLTSCTRFEGRIEERILSPNDSIKVIFLLNKSTSKKYTFTIKQSSLSDNGTKTFQNLFYKLEPGEETQIGRSLVYSPQKYKNEYQIA